MLRFILIVAASLCLPQNAFAAPGDKSLASGIKLFRQGHYEASIQKLSEALRTSSATEKVIASAFMYRGKAHLKSNRPASAIADLNNALWLNTLGNKEHKDIKTTRTNAYNAAGIANTASRQSTTTGFETKVTSHQEKPASASSGANPVSNFFSNVFSPSGPAPEKQNRRVNVKTAPIPSFSTRVQKARPVQPAPKEPTATSSWKTTDALPGSGQSSGTTQANNRKNYMIQLATAASEEMATSKWQSMHNKHHAILGGLVASIEKNTGNGNNSYRILVGPFSNESKTMEACNRLKKRGVDCLINTAGMTR
jgi:cell division septation protein DedD